MYFGRGDDDDILRLHYHLMNTSTGREGVEQANR